MYQLANRGIAKKGAELPHCSA